MKFLLSVLIAVVLIPWGAWGKGGAGHGADQMGASGFKGKVHQVMGHTNVAIDARPGDIQGTLREVGEYGKHAMEATIAGVLQKEGLVVPKTRHFKVSGGSSHRISTHESFFVGFSQRYIEAVKVANPQITEEVLRKKVEHAFKTMKMTLVRQYEAFYKVPLDLAEKLAHKDVLLHFIGDYTTSNTVGLPELEALKRELLAVMEGVWTPEQWRYFNEEITALLAANASANVVAERALDLTLKFGPTVNEVIVRANGGRTIKALPQGKIYWLIRSTRWRLELEVRQKALTFLDINTLTPEELYALDVIGPRPKVGKMGGKFFCSTLDENGLLERYFKEGLGTRELTKIARSMRQKGCSNAQIIYMINHPDVRGGCSGIDAIRRKARTLKDVQKIHEYAKRLAKLRGYYGVHSLGGLLMPKITFLVEGVDIDEASWGRRGKRIFKVGQFKIVKGERQIIFVEGETFVEAKQKSVALIEKLHAAKMQEGIEVIPISARVLHTMNLLSQTTRTAIIVRNIVETSLQLIARDD